MKNKALLFYLAILLPVVILLTMSFLPLMTYFFGETIYLETKPNYSQDFFKGEYVKLDFVINEVSLDLFPEEFQNSTNLENYNDKDLYVVLKKDGDYFTVEYITYNKPFHYYYMWAKIDTDNSYNNRYSKTVYVEYPLDRYFVPEGTNAELENLSNQELVAEVKVWNGYPLLIDVFPIK